MCAINKAFNERRVESGFALTQKFIVDDIEVMRSIMSDVLGSMTDLGRDPHIIDTQHCASLIASAASFAPVVHSQ